MHRSSLVCLLALAACVDVGDDVGEGTSTQELHGAGLHDPGTWFAARTGLVHGCLATKIAGTWAMTSRACGVVAGDTVSFMFYGASKSARVEEVIGRPGTSAAACASSSTCFDSTNLFADIALLRLSADVTASGDPLAANIATLAWNYDATGAGTKVGRVNGYTLTAIDDTVDGFPDGNGSFKTTLAQVDPVDRGGAFWLDTPDSFYEPVLGVLWGAGSDSSNGEYARYTSVPKHLDWILSTIGYRWHGTPAQNGVIPDGYSYETVGGTERVCQYACEHSSVCEAYDWRSGSGSCYLYAFITGTHAYSGAHTGFRYGAVASGQSATNVGYARTDGWNAVVHKTTSGGLHELYRGSTFWFVGGLPTLPGQPPAGKLSGYRRADGINAVVYRSTHDRVVEVALTSTGWTAADLTNWGGPGAAGDPVGYVRADGFSAVVYRDYSGHINELKLGPKGWVHDDLTSRTNINIRAKSDPSPLLDERLGNTAVVFRTTDDEIAMLYHQPYGDWEVHELLALSDNANGLPGYAPTPTGRPFAFVTTAGSITIVYNAGGKLVELREVNGWQFEDLTPSNAYVSGDPAGYVRTDGITSIVYRAGTELHELTRTIEGEGKQDWNLTQQYGLPAVTSDPAAYIRSDGKNAIVFGIANNHVAELSYSAFASGWTYTDMSAESHEVP